MGQTEEAIKISLSYRRHKNIFATLPKKEVDTLRNEELYTINV